MTIKTGLIAEDGHEVVLTEYVCDFPGCVNPAEFVVGAARDIASVFAVCREHAAALKRRAA